MAEWNYVVRIVSVESNHILNFNNMKLLRFNQEPVEIDLTKIESIDAGNGVFTVYLTTGEHYVGYHIKKVWFVLGDKVLGF